MKKSNNFAVLIEDLAFVVDKKIFRQLDKNNADFIFDNIGHTCGISYFNNLKTTKYIKQLLYTKLLEEGKIYENDHLVVNATWKNNDGVSVAWSISKDNFINSINIDPRIGIVNIGNLICKYILKQKTLTAYVIVTKNGILQILGSQDGIKEYDTLSTDLTINDINNIFDGYSDLKIIINHFLLNEEEYKNFFGNIDNFNNHTFDEIVDQYVLSLYIEQEIINFAYHNFDKKPMSYIVFNGQYIIIILMFLCSMLFFIESFYVLDEINNIKTKNKNILDQIEEKTNLLESSKKTLLDDISEITSLAARDVCIAITTPSIAQFWDLITSSIDQKHQIKSFNIIHNGTITKFDVGFDGNYDDGFIVSKNLAFKKGVVPDNIVLNNDNTVIVSGQINNGSSERCMQ